MDANILAKPTKKSSLTELWWYASMLAVRIDRKNQPKETERSMKKVLAGIRCLFGKNARRTGIGLLQILEEYPDQKGTTMWQRVVQTIIEIVYLNPESFFNSPDTFSKTLRGSIKTQFGILAEIEPGEFTTKISFMGFVGDKQAGRYAVVMNFLADSDRPKPVFIYTFEVSLGSNRCLCNVAGIFQDKDQADETKSYQETAQADLVYKGDMVMGLARVFHELTNYPIPPQVATAMGIIGYSELYQYRC
ncbi:MAG: hypothetical protein A3D52_02915 [Candidatus Taylorbacteria bacterium RIFCSPHIGHO2_02_FULL_44_36]|nr:MAG: hypothetical protein A3D52_02915 [Candidatus Taylorbacteria bacterium RIFCSPHIGHO2_02_FULL_44_36]